MPDAANGPTSLSSIEAWLDSRAAQGPLADYESELEECARIHRILQDTADVYRGFWPNMALASAGAALGLASVLFALPIVVLPIGIAVALMGPFGLYLDKIHLDEVESLIKRHNVYQDRIIASRRNPGSF